LFVEIRRAQTVLSIFPDSNKLKNYDIVKEKRGELRDKQPSLFCHIPLLKLWKAIKRHLHSLSDCVVEATKYLYILVVSRLQQNSQTSASLTIKINP
jgi:hypothetical protein